MVAAEKRAKASNEKARQAEVGALHASVALARSASAGRVDESRARMLNAKRQLRAEEAVLQRHAMDEKGRRLQEAKADHALVVAATYRPVDRLLDRAAILKGSVRPPGRWARPGVW